MRSASAIRRVNKLHPVGGSGSYVAPPTYSGDNGNPVHVFEMRRIDGESVSCVLLDSVQSQANRLEESLETAISSGELKLPDVVVDFRDTEVPDIGKISSLRAPHRIFDAIIRDSQLKDGEIFPKSAMGKSVCAATPRNAVSLFRHSPTTLVFGGWNSSGDMGGNGPRFQRCLVSEIIGVNAQAKSSPDGKRMVPLGKKPASRIDPLSITKGIDIYVSGTKKSEWDFEKGNVAKPKKKKPSEINHGNIVPSISEQGVTVDYAKQITVLTLAGLRRLSFPINGSTSRERDLAAWATLAAIALNAITQHDRAGYSLRSRCDLYPEKRSSFEVINNDGSVVEVDIAQDEAANLLAESTKFAKEQGLPWDTEPVMLVPQSKLVELVKRSRDIISNDGDHAGS